MLRRESRSVYRKKQTVQESRYTTRKGCEKGQKNDAHVVGGDGLCQLHSASPTILLEVLKSVSAREILATRHQECIHPDIGNCVNIKCMQDC